VATLAEARHFAHFGAAFRAFHCALLSGSGRRRNQWRRHSCLRVFLRQRRRSCRFIRAAWCASRHTRGGLACAVWCAIRRTGARLPGDGLVRGRTAHAEILPGWRAARAAATRIRAALISCTKVQPQVA